MKKYIPIFIISVLLITGGYFYIDYGKKEAEKNKVSQIVSKNDQLKTQDTEKISENSETQEITKEIASQKIEQKVAFIVQAPFGNWKEAIFQNACEEASMIMAMSWINGIKDISAQNAQKQIENIVDFENKKFGYNTDTDTNDMQIVFRDFFNYQNTYVRQNIVLDDIKNEIQKGNVVLVPAFGRALKNPNYTNPGPVAHMLVIIGYDPVLKKFITNDSGTKHGSGYVYPEGVLFEAIWAYDSGSKAPQPPEITRKKSMLVVMKSQE